MEQGTLFGILLALLCFCQHSSGTDNDPSIHIHPPSVVVRYGSPVSVNCSTNITVPQIGWEASQDSNASVNTAFLTWNVDKVTDWDLEPFCFANFIGEMAPRASKLNLTIYEIPDHVSINVLGHTGPMMEDSQYELQCDIQNVAPVKLLTVNWYKGETLLGNKPFSDFTKTPVNVSPTFQIFPNRTDNGAQYWCEAVLNLGPDGPQPPPKVSSDPLNITVHYKPVINKDKLPEYVPVFRGYPEVLNCEAEGLPPPSIKWYFNSNLKMEGGRLTIINAESGMYNCTATNSRGTSSTVVEVVVKEDYLPLIAGFVALVVVIISIIFICIYCIYYKNTKMGRYTVKGAKPNAQNGNVAQNGRDNTIPMKKLPQEAISV